MPWSVCNPVAAFSVGHPEKIQPIEFAMRAEVKSRWKNQNERWKNFSGDLTNGEGEDFKCFKCTWMPGMSWITGFNEWLKTITHYPQPKAHSVLQFLTLNS